MLNNRNTRVMRSVMLYKGLMIKARFSCTANTENTVIANMLGLVKTLLMT